AEGAFVVAEKVRESVAAHSFADGKGNRGVHVTVSIGLATYPSSAADREELLRQADDALYQAKHLGRDRVRAPRSVAVSLSSVTEPDDAPAGGGA
ncbi:MAG: GGDEF domain-containing protein, partial [Coriobacteriia bacterium]|nr:GGDEF domain-containing protein [Coriobacteriia bacterium]